MGVLAHAGPSALLPSGTYGDSGQEISNVKAKDVTKKIHKPREEDTLQQVWRNRLAELKV